MFCTAPEFLKSFCQLLAFLVAYIEKNIGILSPKCSKSISGLI